MKIGFLLFSPGISGGSYVVYEHGSRLKRKGHYVALITPQQVRADEYAWHPSAHELDWLTLAQAETEAFDIVLATWWETFFLLCKLQSRHYVYFAQSIESRFFAPPDFRNFRNLELTIWQNLCEKTYACALPVITEAAWIQEYIHQKYNNWPYLVRNGIRKDIYTAEGRAIAPRRPGSLRVLVEGPVEIFFKNVPVAIKLAKEAGVDEIWLLTSSAIQEHPDVDRIFSRVPIHETPLIYRSCDLVLKLSYVEGMFGPPLEMFHCGGTALVYDVTGHDEYIIHDQNAYVVPKDDEAQVVRLLRHLKENPAEVERLKQGAAKTAAAWPDWDACSAQFEQTLLTIAAARPASREAVQRYTDELHSIPPPFIRAKMLEDLATREKIGKEDADQNNFISFSWDGQGKFTDEKLQWRHYLSGEWTTAIFELRVEEVPLWLRINPTVRVGILEIASISLLNKTKNREIFSCSQPDEFHLLLLEGAISWPFPEYKNIVFSYGHYSSLILPIIESESICLSDLLEVSIKMKETGIQQFIDGKQVCITERRSPDQAKKNVIQFYWDSAGKFIQKKSQQQDYCIEEWTEFSFQLRIEEVPLWLRLNLSCRPGMIEVDYIAVQNTMQQKEIMAFRKPEDFQVLFLTGDLTWIFPERKNIMCSSGAESMLILPVIEQDITLGDLLKITIKMRESSVRQFFEREQSLKKEQPRPRWKQLLRTLHQQLGKLIQ